MHFTLNLTLILIISHAARNLLAKPLKDVRILFKNYWICRPWSRTWSRALGLGFEILSLVGLTNFRTVCVHCDCSIMQKDNVNTTPADVVEKRPLNDEAKPATAAAVTVDDDNVVKLKPKITLLNGITVIVGSIIGSGIFISPKGVLQEVQSVGMSLIIWFACGLFSMVGAYCYTELGTAIVRSGADYAYMFEAFGPFLAFLRLWVECMIVRPCAAAIVALTFANYVIEPLFPTCPQPEVAVRLLAAVAIGKFLG